MRNHSGNSRKQAEKPGQPEVKNGRLRAPAGPRESRAAWAQRVRERQLFDRKYLTAEEWRRVLDEAAREPRDLALVLVIYEGALRASEVGKLTLASLAGLHKREIVVERGKGSLTSRVEISRTARQAIYHWLDVCYPDKRARTPKQWVFPGRSDVPGSRRKVSRGLSRSSVYAILHDLMLAAEVPELLAHPHTLKHTRVMHVVAAAEAAGLPWHRILPVVARLVGHRQAETTLRWYVGVRDEDRAIAATLTDTLIRSGTAPHRLRDRKERNSQRDTAGHDEP